MRQIRIRPWHGGLVVLLAACVAAVVLISDNQANRRSAPLPDGASEPRGPITMVSLGDSSVSGEGTGVYTPTTNGQNGNWCHRSPKATVHMTSVPGIEKTVNLACSGAASAHVALTKQTKYGEGSQSARLRQLAATNEIEVVVVAVGANDDPSFSHRLSACAKAWFGGPLCTAEMRRNWPATIDAMVPKVVRALKDVRKVLAQVGYDRDDYQLVVQSYPSPVSPKIPDNLRNLAGCPFRPADLEWIRGRAVPELGRGMRQAADAVDARFLDLSRAGYGHEACTGGTNASNEWFTRLTVRWNDLDDVDRASHAAQESFHLNVAGHAQIGRCLTEFLANTTSEAACREGTDGDLHPTVLP